LVCGDRSGVCSDSSFGAGFDPLCALVFPALDRASVAWVSACLDRPIERLKLAKQIDILRELMYYLLAMRVMNNHAHQEGIPENVAFQEAIKYDRDIVPSFSASVYFTLAGNLARILSQFVYRVRLVHFDKALVNIDPEATVVFVMNHGSNMDYVLVTYLASQRSVLSYVVGESARVSSISRLISRCCLCR